MTWQKGYIIVKVRKCCFFLVGVKVVPYPTIRWSFPYKSDLMYYC